MAPSSASSSSTKQALKWKWLGRVLTIIGFGAPIILLPLFFDNLSVYWGIGLVIFGVFLGIQGMALSSFAEIKETEGQDPILEEGKKKRAVLWYTCPNLICSLVGLAFIFQMHMFNVSLVEFGFLPRTLSTGILLGGLFGLASTLCVLEPKIHKGIIGEGDKRTQKFSRFFWILQVIVPLATFQNRAMICHYFSSTNLSTCQAPTIIFGSFFLGIFLIEFLWILNWERQNNQKLYM